MSNFTLKELVRSSFLENFNFWIMQWFCVRIGYKYKYVIKNNKRKRIKKYLLVKYPKPLTGWWNDFKWIGGEQKY
jgi:hypothetical protein